MTRLLRTLLPLVGSVLLLTSCQAPDVAPLAEGIRQMDAHDAAGHEALIGVAAVLDDNALALEDPAQQADAREAARLLREWATRNRREFEQMRDLTLLVVAEIARSPAAQTVAEGRAAAIEIARIAFGKERQN